MTLQACVAWAEEMVDSISEIQSRVSLGESGTEFPLTLVYGGDGSFTSSTISGKAGNGNYNVTVEIHYPQENIASNIADTNAVIDAFMVAFRTKIASVRSVTGIGAVGSPTFSRFFSQIGQIKTHGPVFTIPISSEDEA